MSVVERRADGTATLRGTLEGPGVHEGWEQAYRSVRNEAFYDLAFEPVASR